MIECSISVIMSFYNEKKSEIIRAVNSIINQTFQDWELIVICDDPSNTELYDSLIKHFESNKNVFFVLNKKNIGLALSMNKAAELSSGKYLARMDADDVCIFDRLEKQYDYMEKNNLDLSCTDYYFVDEEENILSINVRKYNNSNIKKYLPYCNTIHHPTVMMKKTSFDKVKGYRNFPCAQDYDLWLRMYENNMSMKIIEEKLLKYTIRKDSVTQSKKMIQLLTIWYIHDMHTKKGSRHSSNFDEQNYILYLKKNGVYNADAVKTFERHNKIKDSVDKMRGCPKKLLARYALIIRLIFISRIYRQYYFRLFYTKCMLLFMR